MRAISIRKDNPTIDYKSIVSRIGSTVYLTHSKGRVCLRGLSPDDLISNICSVTDWMASIAPFGGLTAVPAMLTPCEITILGDHVVIYEQLKLSDFPCLSAAGPQVKHA